MLGVLVATDAVPAGWANVVATAVGTVPSFELNRRWVWGKTGAGRCSPRSGPFAALSFAGLVLSTARGQRRGGMGRRPTARRRAAHPGRRGRERRVLRLAVGRCSSSILDRLLFASGAARPRGRRSERHRPGAGITARRVIRPRRPQCARIDPTAPPNQDLSMTLRLRLVIALAVLVTVGLASSASPPTPSTRARSTSGSTTRSARRSPLVAAQLASRRASTRQHGPATRSLHAAPTARPRRSSCRPAPTASCATASGAVLATVQASSDGSQPKLPTDLHVTDANRRLFTTARRRGRATGACYVDPPPTRRGRRPSSSRCRRPR